MAESESDKDPLFSSLADIASLCLWMLTLLSEFEKIIPCKLMDQLLANTQAGKPKQLQTSNMDSFCCRSEQTGHCGTH